MNKRLTSARASGVTPYNPRFRGKSRSLPPSEGRPSACAPATPAAGVGVGGDAARGAPASGTTRGAPAFVQRVRNLGRGVWGFGVVLGWIPADVSPWHWAKRKGLTQIFSRRTKPLTRTRPYVLGDDGRHHLAQRWEEV